MDHVGEPEKVSRARMDCCVRACLDQWATMPGHKSSDPFEVSFVLNNWNINTYPSIYGSLKLKHNPTVNLNVCILGENHLCKEAKDHSLPFINSRGLRSMHRKTKLIAKIVGKYDLFLASPTIMKKIPRSLDAALNRAAKRLFVVKPGESLPDKIRKTRVTVRFRSKNIPYILLPIGNIGMKLRKLVDNLKVAIKKVVSRLPREWENVMCIHVALKNGRWMPVYN
ncbi:large ribosomal subunit protein uL1-like [Haemaphysalis longicornis]